MVNTLSTLNEAKPTLEEILVIVKVALVVIVVVLTTTLAGGLVERCAYCILMVKLVLRL